MALLRRRSKTLNYDWDTLVFASVTDNASDNSVSGVMTMILYGICFE